MGEEGALAGGREHEARTDQGRAGQGGRQGAPLALPKNHGRGWASQCGMKALGFIQPWILPFPSDMALGKWFLFPQFYFLMCKVRVTTDAFGTVVTLREVMCTEGRMWPWTYNK